MTEVVISHVTKVIRKNKVLDDISILMKSGVIYGLQGINGSGKTMLMRIIIGLIHPTSGSVHVNGKMLGKDIDFPQSIGFLIENPAFLDGYSGFDNLKMLTKVQNKLSDDTINQWLAEVGLGDTGNKKYKKYSLGMKQRLGIAAAMMESPDIIVLDEPTNALDTSGIEKLKGLIMKQKARGAIIVISCHDTDTLRKLSDVIFMLDDGRLVDTINVEEASENV